MTIESSVRNKVVELHLNNKKRSEIVYNLNLSGIKISTGSVSNIISEWRQRQSGGRPSVREQPDLNKSDRVTTFPEETLADKEFKNSKDISIEKHVITNTQDLEENGFWFTKGPEEVNNKSSEVITEDEKSIDEKLEVNSLHTPSLGSPTSTGVGQPISITTTKDSTSTSKVDRNLQW